MTFCGALNRSNKPYRESIMEPCVSKNQKGSLLCGFYWERNPEKGFRQWKKSIHEVKAEFVYLIM